MLTPGLCQLDNTKTSNNKYLDLSCFISGLGPWDRASLSGTAGFEICKTNERSLTVEGHPHMGG